MKTTFKMYYDDVRIMCIKNELCTKCTCKQYDELLKICDFECKSFLTLQNKLLKIATLMCNYSDEQTIENIMYLLMKNCVNTFFEI